MALDASVLVDLPEHGIAYKKVSGKTYVYYVTATYRNKNGNPTCDRSSIGRLDEASGKLIPNRNYYEIFLKQPIPPAGDLFCCGVFDVFDRVCDTLGVKKLLKRYFPEHCKEILTVAQYLLSEVDKLKCTVFPNGRSPHLIVPPTKTIRDIYALLGFQLPTCIG